MPVMSAIRGTGVSETAAERKKLLVERLHAHSGMTVVPVSDDYTPRLTADRAILDVILSVAASRIERDRVRLAAVRARHHPARVGSAVAERKVPVEVELVRAVVLIVKGESHSVTYCACAGLAPYN